MKTTLKIAITVDSNVKDCYNLRDSVAGALIGMKQTWEADDETTIEFKIIEVVMPEAGRYEVHPVPTSIPEDKP